MGKTRPAIVVSPPSVGRLPLRIVVPITDWKSRYSPVPWLVHLKPNRRNGLSKESAADCFQVKSVSVGRFVRKLGALRANEIEEISAEIAAKRMVGWMGLGAGKYHDWKLRYGKVNEHNALVSRDHWLEESEKQAIVNFHVQYPLEGYRRLTFMMLDRDVVAASPSSVYRVLQKAGLEGLHIGHVEDAVAVDVLVPFS
jgi:mRNA-degrading endonuclease toxin of MazEF toxin-antitoxin module